MCSLKRHSKVGLTFSFDLRIPLSSCLSRVRWRTKFRRFDTGLPELSRELTGPRRYTPGLTSHLFDETFTLLFGVDFISTSAVRRHLHVIRFEKHLKRGYFVLVFSVTLFFTLSFGYSPLLFLSSRQICICSRNELQGGRSRISTASVRHPSTELWRAEIIQVHRSRLAFTLSPLHFASPVTAIPLINNALWLIRDLRHVPKGMGCPDRVQKPTHFIW